MHVTFDSKLRGACYMKQGSEVHSDGFWMSS